jgi:hypothetical protein
MSTIKYTNLNDTDMIYLLVESTDIYYRAIAGDQSQWAGIRWTFRPNDWSRWRIREIYRKINDIRKKYKLLSVPVGAPLEDCWEGLPPQKLHVL